MNIDRFDIDKTKEFFVLKNGERFYATLGDICSLYVLENELIAMCKSSTFPGTWVECFDREGKKKWVLIDCSIDPVAYEGDKDKRVEYQTYPPDLTVRPSAHVIYYKNKEIYITKAIIEWVLFADDRIYIVTNEYKTHRNIHCIDTDGRYLWNVEPFGEEGGFYTSVTCRGENVWANSTASYDCCIDSQTGKITDRVFGK